MKKKILRPLPPHLTLFMSQLTSTFPISHRISGAFLATMVLFSHFLCPKMGLICLTHQNFYQSSPISSKVIPSLVSLTAFALLFHLFIGVCHFFPYFSQKIVDFLERLLKSFLSIYLFFLRTSLKTLADDEDWDFSAVVNQALNRQPNPQPPVGEEAPLPSWA